MSDTKIHHLISYLISNFTSLSSNLIQKTDVTNFVSFCSTASILPVSFIQKHNLKAIMNGEELKPKFKKAVLRDRSGDINKRWYVEFYVWDVQKNKLVRKQDYIPEDYKKASARKLYAKERIRQINKLLRFGYHIDRKKEHSTGEQIIYSLKDAINRAMEVKEQSSLAHGSKNAYRSARNIFLDFVKNKQMESMLVNDFSTYNSTLFMDWLRTDRQISSAKTINKYRDFMKTFWNEMKSRQMVIGNPWENIKKEKERTSSQNIAFLDDEIKILKGILPSKDFELWLFVQIMYYTFARPNEIRQLKVQNILFSKKRIFIPAEISKPGKDRHAVIPEKLFPILKKLCENKSSGDYLFPGKQQGKCISKNRMSDRHRDILKELNINENCTLYSWKHTGVVRAYENGVGIKGIQMQCGHHSISETDTYLKSLHLYGNNEFILKMPDL